MQGITLETPVVSNTDSGNVINIYNTVINTMLLNADRILVAIDTSDGDRVVLTAAINALHSLVANCIQYSLHGCLTYAMKKGQTEVVQKAIRHPLIKVILLYLYSGGMNSGIYIDWTIKIFLSRVGFLGLRQMVRYNVL